MSFKSIFSNVWRDWVVEGVPSSGANEPSKADIRAIGPQLDQSFAATAQGMLSYATAADLPTDPAPDEGTQARVYADSTAANNGVWIYKSGAWAFDTDYYDAVAAVVQPLVDSAQAWATSATEPDPTGNPGDQSAKTYATAAAASAVEFETFRDDTLSTNTDITRGVAAPVGGTLAFSAGVWVLPVACDLEETLLEFEIMTSNTGTASVAIARYSKSGSTYTEEQMSAALNAVAQPTTNLYTPTDFGSIVAQPGEFWGFWTNSAQAVRRAGAPLSPVAWEYGGSGHPTSFTATQNVAFNQVQARIKTSARELVVTATRFVALEAAVATDKNIILFADSLGTDSLGFVDELAALMIDRTITGQGVGGQQAGSIAVRTGGLDADATVTGASIPASGSGVVITAISPDPFAASIGTNASFIASLHDVPGVLSKASSTYTFTRSDTGGAIALTNPVKLRIRSTFVTNTTGAGAVMLPSLTGRVGVLRDGHNDVFNDVIRDISTYDRQAVKNYIADQVDALGGKGRTIVCSITRGFAWLTQARCDALTGATYPAAGSIQGWAADDAETIAAVIECNALNQWMADTYPGFVDLDAAIVSAEPAVGDYMTSIDLGSGNVYLFGNATLRPDGTHGADGGVEQTVSAQAVANKITGLGL